MTGNDVDADRTPILQLDERQNGGSDGSLMGGRWDWRSYRSREASLARLRKGLAQSFLRTRD